MTRLRTMTTLRPPTTSGRPDIRARYRKIRPVVKPRPHPALTEVKLLIMSPELCSRTTGCALWHSAVRQRIDRKAGSRLPASDISSPSAGKGSALWPNPSSFTAFAQPVVPPFGVFCLHRLSHEPLKFLPSSTFGPSRHSRADTMASADSCRLNPTFRLGLPSEDCLATGLPR